MARKISERRLELGNLQKVQFHRGSRLPAPERSDGGQVAADYNFAT
jgi:hypothetical protein